MTTADVLDATPPALTTGDAERIARDRFGETATGCTGLGHSI